MTVVLLRFFFWFEDGEAGNLAVIGALALRRNRPSWKYQAPNAAAFR
jgi:hypothetical protein